VIEALRRKAIVGTAEQVAARLSELAQRLELDELVVVTWTFDPVPRHRSYKSGGRIRPAIRGVAKRGIVMQQNPAHHGPVKLTVP
jgi:hypothetical protein